MQSVYNKNLNPWLSVIVPVYNAEKYLDKCIKSILNQTFTDFELIIVDDGSTDNSANIVTKYSNQDKRVVYLSKQNTGSFDSRLYGVKHSKGKYITFCDSDDYYSSKKAFMTFYNEINKSNCSVLQFYFIKKYNHLYLQSKPKSETPMDFDRKTFLNDQYPKLLCSFWGKSCLTSNLWNKVYERSLYDDVINIDFPERFFWGDDLILNLFVMSKCERFRVIPDALYCYRQNSGGTKKFKKSIMNDLDTIKKYQLIVLESCSYEFKDKIIRMLFSEVAGWFYIYIKDAVNFLSREELKELINTSFELPSFIKAREYYLQNPNENYEEVNLFREANADKYIEVAQRLNSKKSIKSIITDILKRI